MTHASGGLPATEYDVQSGAPALSIQAPAESATESPAPPRSPLGDLRRKHREIRDHLYLDLRVPGWGEDPDEDPRVSIFTRHRPLRPSELNDIQEARSKSGKHKRNSEWVDFGNADVLIKTCTEVWAQSGDPLDPSEIDEAERLSLHPGEGVHGAKTRLDGNLADALGMERDMDGKPPGAVQIVRHLYLHDGNIAAAAIKLMRWSNLRNPDADTDFTNG